jgi:hypothetical protein
MTIDEFRLEVASHRRAMTEKGKSGHTVRYTAAGPVGMSLIDKLVELLETQQRQLDELKATVNSRRLVDAQAACR